MGVCRILYCGLHIRVSLKRNSFISAWCFLVCFLSFFFLSFSFWFNFLLVPYVHAADSKWQSRFVGFFLCRSGRLMASNFVHLLSCRFFFLIWLSNLMLIAFHHPDLWCLLYLPPVKEQLWLVCEIQRVHKIRMERPASMVQFSFCWCWSGYGLPVMACFASSQILFFFFFF